MNPYPTPASLADYIYQQEIPRLQLLYPDLPVLDIMRYGAIIGSTCHYFSKRQRCMAEARSLIQQVEEEGLSFSSGMIIGAGELGAGSGRFQRAWHAPPGGLWFSLVLVNTLSPSCSRLLPLMAGLACHSLLVDCGLPARLKWVNDVMLAKKKVAGILTESLRGSQSAEEYILLGLGLNVNNLDFPAELTDLATSMAAQAKHEFDLAQLACGLLAKLSWYYGLLVYLDENNNGDPSPFMAIYRQSCDSVGRRVSYGFDVQLSPLYEAEITAIAGDGSLVMELDGAEIRETGGEIRYL